MTDRLRPSSPLLDSAGWPTRRSILAGGAGALASLSLAGRATATAPSLRTRRSGAKKKILMLGGTGFLGPAIVQAALDAGHEVTLFNRGRTDPGLFADLEQLRGNRRRPMREGMPEQDLSALKGREWDCAIDTSAYFTRNMEDMVGVLKDQVGHYTFISSISVYKDLEKNSNPVDESSELCTCDDPYTWEMGANYENYGALKAYCEKAVEAGMPGRGLYVRPGYIVGPRDNSDRFTYWPVRVASRGGRILAPGHPEAMQQFIDVRDLGTWIVHAVTEGLTGAFNATGFKGRISTAELLHTMKGTLNHECEFTWVDDGFLQAEGVSAWGEMPCWTPASLFNVSANDKAIAAGLTFRPIAETIRATWEWARDQRGMERPWRAGMTAEREAELLQKWLARGDGK